MDNLDRLYERKKFLKIIFPEIDKDEYIRIFQNKNEFNKVTFWNDIDDLNSYIENNKFNANTYFNLSTTDGQGGTIENLKYRYVLGWDFDKKLDNKIDAKEIMFRFKELKLWYHAIIDSGYGYHVYMCIEKTSDLKKITKVTEIIGKKIGADTNAMKSTQILRIPLTFNFKYNKSKQVNIINIFNKSTIKPYNIDKLYNKYCGNIEDEERTIKYAINKSNFPPCIINILKGVNDGDRNFAMKRLISFLKLYKYNQTESWNIVKEWNNKNNPPLTEAQLEYQFNYIFKKSYNCFGCITNDTILQSQIKKYCMIEECKNRSKEEILFVEGETIQMEYKICKKLEKQRKNIFQLKGNHLVIIGILKNNLEGLTTDEIVNKLTYKGKCNLSNKTLFNILNELADNKYIIKIVGNKRKREKDFYKINEIRCEEFKKINISYFAILGVIKENITSEDLKIYCYMRYRLSKGLSLTQEKIADEMGISQQAISLHINNLIREKYIELKYVDYSSNGLGVNIYKLNL